MHGRSPLMTLYRGEPVNIMLLFIAMAHAWAYPPHYNVIWGVPVNHNVTIYSDDSCRVWLKAMYCYYK